VLGDLDSLGDRIADQPHAAELTNHVHSWARGLEKFVHFREIDSAFRGAKDELDRTGGAFGGAFAVADAVGGLDQPSLSVDNAQDVALRASSEAGEAADTGFRVDDRVK